MDREAAEDRLAGDPALHRQIGEDRSLCRLDIKRFAIGNECRGIKCQCPPADRRRARGATQGDPHRAALYFEAAGKGADFNCRRRLSGTDERVGSCKRPAIKRTCRAKPITLTTEASEILYRRHGTHLKHAQLAQGCTFSAIISPAAARASRPAKRSAAIGANVTSSPGSTRNIGSRPGW